MYLTPYAYIGDRSRSYSLSNAFSMTLCKFGGRIVSSSQGQYVSGLSWSWHRQRSTASDHPSALVPGARASTHSVSTGRALTLPELLALDSR